MERCAGILLPIFTLPSNQGIGDLGLHCIRLIDKLKQCHFKIWQILPLNPIGFGHSPYQPYSSFAGDEIYINLDAMADYEYFPRSSIKNCNKFADAVDYELVREFKEPYFKKGFKTFNKYYERYQKDYEAFCKDAFWLDAYALYIALKKHYNNEWVNWPSEARDYWKNPKGLDISIFEDEIKYQKFLQFVFYQQWHDVKKYANEQGIKIMGDIPFYMGLDSCDVWQYQDEFLLDDECLPTFVAGVPPDYFSEDGQRWGNPIYNWIKMKGNDYHFWFERLGWNQKQYDMIRIDHFRAFDTYWRIPASSETAKKGEWVLGPRNHFFDSLYKKYPNIDIVVEDLGDIRDEVVELKNDYHLAGMKILQFELLPRTIQKEYDPNVIYYTGTHDNDTMQGFYSKLSHNEKIALRRYLDKCGYENKYFNMLCMQIVLDSEAKVAMLPLWDIIGGKKKGRINTPGTLNDENWTWKLKNNKFLFMRLEALASLIENSKRA